MLRCETCHKDINLKFPDIKYNDWLKLMHYFEHEVLEGEITELTFNEMTDALMSVKPWLKEEK